jgi:ribosomal protein L37E
MQSGTKSIGWFERELVRSLTPRSRPVSGGISPCRRCGHSPYAEMP